MNFYLFFFVAGCLHLTITAYEYWRVISGGNFLNLVAKYPKAVFLDSILVITFFWNAILGIQQFQGQQPSLALSIIVWFAFSGIAIHRIDEEIALIRANIKKGELE